MEMPNNWPERFGPILHQAHAAKLEYESAGLTIAELATLAALARPVCGDEIKAMVGSAAQWLNKPLSRSSIENSASTATRKKWITRGRPSVIRLVTDRGREQLSQVAPAALEPEPSQAQTFFRARLELEGGCTTLSVEATAASLEESMGPDRVMHLWNYSPGAKTGTGVYLRFDGVKALHTYLGDYLNASAAARRAAGLGNELDRATQRPINTVHTCRD